MTASEKIPRFKHLRAFWQYICGGGASSLRSALGLGNTLGVLQPECGGTGVTNYLETEVITTLSITSTTTQYLTATMPAGIWMLVADVTWASTPTATGKQITCAFSNGANAFSHNINGSTFGIEAIKGLSRTTTVLGIIANPININYSSGATPRLAFQNADVTSINSTVKITRIKLADFPS